MFEILIMGGSQFVSEALAKYLIAKGHNVDIFTRGIRPLQYEGVRHHMIGDRNSDDELKQNLKNKTYDFVFDITAYHTQHVEKLKGNLNPTKLKRYVFFSSGGVYLPSSDLLLEDSTKGKHPELGDYGINKKEAEDYLFQMYKEENFPITIFRPPYIYGEGNNIYRENYIFDRLIQDLPIPIPRGNTEVHFIHIDDVVRVLESVMYNKKSNGQAFNLTYPENITWTNLIHTAANVAEKKASIVEIDEEKLDESIRTRHYFPYLNFVYILDHHKLEDFGLYNPTIQLQDGLERAYQYYKEAKPQHYDAAMSKVDEVLI
jgi:nucleoside-diphosphate-sugar epimerase